MLYAAAGRTAPKERHRVVHERLVEGARRLARRAHRRALATGHPIAALFDLSLMVLRGKDFQHISSARSGHLATAAMTQETRSFQAEVSRLLEIVAHSLYSEKEIFLRELISNASDACDRLRYAALTEPALTDGNTDYRVVLTPDKSARTLTVADNGVGMNRDELIENLGTIARSGTAAFVNQLSGDARKDMSLIGQFGVGFYSAFMVAEKVEVLSRKAGENEGWRWVSDGKGEFTIEAMPEATRGAKIVVH